jgi:hypothetical protein
MSWYIRIPLLGFFLAIGLGLLGAIGYGVCGYTVHPLMPPFNAPDGILNPPLFLMALVSAGAALTLFVWVSVLELVFKLLYWWRPALRKGCA